MRSWIGDLRFWLWTSLGGAAILAVMAEAKVIDPERERRFREMCRRQLRPMSDRAIAYQLGAGFIPVRKPGKLPAETISEEYELEYGTDKVELHRDAIAEGTKVLIVDDLLATGGTAAASAKLVERLGGEIVGIVFLIELGFLNGRSKLAGYKVDTLINYNSE